MIRKWIVAYTLGAAWSLLVQVPSWIVAFDLTRWPYRGDHVGLMAFAWVTGTLCYGAGRTQKRTDDGN